MPTVKELVRFIRNRRGQYHNIYGHCHEVATAVDAFPEAIRGESGVYVCNTDDRTARRPSHYVAVIRTRGRSGAIVQFSGMEQNDRRILLGVVPDVHNRKSIIERLITSVGFTGWKKVPYRRRE